MKLSDFIDVVINKTGMLTELDKEDTVESRSRIENIRELISVAIDLESKGQGNTLEEFLENVSLATDIDNVEEGQEAVTLMTLHSAKGLEFPIVFMVGMEEGIFPSNRSIVSQTELEEERRLCYVGITRAKKCLYITNARRRTLYGSTMYNRHSRFVDEMPQHLLDDLGCLSGCLEEEKNFDVEYSKTTAKSVFTNVPPMDKQVVRPKQVSKEPAKNIAQDFFAVGDRVNHKKFGDGIIKSVRPGSTGIKLDIVFEQVGIKHLIAEYAGLVKIAT